MSMKNIIKVVANKFPYKMKFYKTKFFTTACHLTCFTRRKVKCILTSLFYSLSTKPSQTMVTSTISYQKDRQVHLSLAQRMGHMSLKASKMGLSLKYRSRPPGGI